MNHLRKEVRMKHYDVLTLRQSGGIQTTMKKLKNNKGSSKA
jgi:hypothetical protein